METPQHPSRLPRIALFALLVINGIVLIAWFVLLPLQKTAVEKKKTPEIITTDLVQTQDSESSFLATPMLGDLNLSDKEGMQRDGVIILALDNGESVNLFGFHPLYMPVTQINPGVSYDETTPVLSTDGSRMAFASRENGYWDIYLEDTSNLQVLRVTDTLPFDNSPTFSPDSQWLAYTSYQDEDLEIFLQSLTDPTSAPIQLTNDRAADYSPAWSPTGRVIAFISNRAGQPDIWLADLDKIEDRFTNLTNSISAVESHPAWSPDGRFLAWSGSKDGFNNIYLWDSQAPSKPAYILAPGLMPTWNPSGEILLAAIESPNETGLVGYQANTGLTLLPYTPMPGMIDGMSWLAGEKAQTLVDSLLATEPYQVKSLWQPILTLQPGPQGRRGVVMLNNVNAPYPYLHDAVDESFLALTEAVGKLSGWNFLANLENAYLPLTEPPTPGSPENWLYTGRAIAVNGIPLQAGWMAISREEFQGETYWRIFLKTRYQDGSQGQPLTAPIWDINARFSGDTVAYEAGGKIGVTPPGYWMDFTTLARTYGWLRQPALINWRTFFPATRFNLFVLADGLDWQQAMLEMYSPEALATTTPFPTKAYTPTPTRVIIGTPQLTPTPLPSATATYSPTPRPTWTIQPAP